VPTFIGTTQLGLHEVVYRTRFARDRGADGILLGLPMWQPCTVDTAVEFYRTMSVAFPELALMVYGNTRAFRFEFGPDFWAQVAKAAPTVMAAKFARPKDFPAAFAAAGDRIHFLPHEAAVMKFYDMQPATTTACWSTAASMGPEPALAIMRAINGGRIDEAREIAKDLAWAGQAVEDLVAKPELFASYNIQVEKTRIAAAGYCKTGPIRPPYQVFPEEYAALARENGRRWAELRTKYASQAAPA
jgi:dihydrodipicolinate synthase/N-acetylneuraminate lyase